MGISWDLHSHSLRSDGTLTPTALVERAAEKGVDVLALTDHDVTDGIAEAQAAAVRVGIRLLPGVEVSATWDNKTVHIVGLGIDPDNPTLNAGLAELRTERDVRGREIAERLARAGLEGVHEGASELAQGQILSRTHFARYLVEQGHARDIGKAFRKFLHKGKPGHVRTQWCDIDEAIGWIRAAGGRAVLAHPERYPLGSGKMQRLLTEFKQCGGEGVEVVSSSHTVQGIARFARYACEHELLASRGSDFHGPETTWVELGRLPALPPECTPVWHDDFEGSGTEDTLKARQVS